MLRMEADPHQELAALVRAFRERLRWELDHGVVGVATVPAPRFGVAADVAAPAAAPVAVEEDLAPRPSLEEVRAELGECQRCRLAGKRHNIVFGEGSPDADLMFIGEAPGHDEDAKGRPFVGPAGQLLTKMILAMGLEREEVYIGNIIKCRPPGNRDPSPDEIDACEPFLRRQIDAIGPRMIIALGNAAAKTLLRTDTGISQLRGRFHTYHGIPLMPTFHPAFLLRNPERKRPVWEDLKMVMAEMDRLGLRRRS
jgi:uracil-DNA glycosylase family 4